MIWNVDISKTMRARARKHGTSLVDSDICHWMAPLRKSILVTLSYFLKSILVTLSYFLIVKPWNVNICEIVRESRKIHLKTFTIFLFAIEWCQCENCTPYSWPTSKVTNFEAVRNNAKMHRTTFTVFDICHQIIPLRKLYGMILTYFLKTKMEMLLSRKQW